MFERKWLAVIFTIVTLLVLCPATLAESDIPIDYAHFPNYDFRRVLLDEYDRNRDERFSQEEIDDIEFISINGYENITSLQGIGYFTELRFLECDGTSITSLDLSQCTKLTNLSCRYCKLAEINVSHCPELEGLYCYANQLSTIDISNCPLLLQYITPDYQGEYSPVGKSADDVDYWDKFAFDYYFESFEPGYGGIAYDKGVRLITGGSTSDKKLYPLRVAQDDQKLTTIEAEAFADTDLTEFRLPETVEYIAEDAFNGSSIRTIYAVRNTYAWNWALAHGFVEAADDPEELKGFKLSASSEYVIEGVPVSIAFVLKCETDMTDRNIMLYDQQKTLLGRMHDDGIDGDDTANDGQFTLAIDYTASETGTVEFYAQSGNAASEPIVLYAYMPITADTVPTIKQQVLTVKDVVNAAEDSYTDAAGYVRQSDVKKAVSAVAAKLEQLKEKGDVLYYKVYDENIYIKLSSGITEVYQPRVEGVAGGGPEDPVAMCILNGTTADLYDTEIGKAAEGVKNHYYDNKFVVMPELTTTQITPNSIISHYGTNRIIYWLGHGCYIPEVGPYSQLGVTYDWALANVSGNTDDYYWEEQHNYFDELYIINAGDTDICVTPRFYEEKCPDLSNTLVLLLSCSSTHDERLAYSLLYHKAAAVVGYDNAVYSRYATAIDSTLLKYMTDIDPETNDYYTLEKALEIAKGTWGNDDREWALAKGVNPVKQDTAKPDIMGGQKAKEYQLFHAVELKGYMGSAIQDAAESLGDLTSGVIQEQDEKWFAYANNDVELYSTGGDSDKIWRITLKKSSPYGLFGLHVGMASSALEPFFKEYGYTTDEEEASVWYKFVVKESTSNPSVKETLYVNNEKGLISHIEYEKKEVIELSGCLGKTTSKVAKLIGNMRYDYSMGEYTNGAVRLEEITWGGGGGSTVCGIEMKGKSSCAILGLQIGASFTDSDKAALKAQSEYVSVIDSRTKVYSFNWSLPAYSSFLGVSKDIDDIGNVCGLSVTVTDGKISNMYYFSDWSD